MLATTATTTSTTNEDGCQVASNEQTAATLALANAATLVHSGLTRAGVPSWFPGEVVVTHIVLLCQSDGQTVRG